MSYDELNFRDQVGLHESESYPIAHDDFDESDDFMGTVEDEHKIWEAFNAWPEELETVPDDADLASQYQVVVQPDMVCDADFDESDGFMGNAEDERQIREAFQSDDDMLNDGEPISDSVKPAQQYQVLESSPEICESERCEAQPISEEEREARRRAVAEYMSGFYGVPEIEGFEYPEEDDPEARSEGAYSDWDIWMVDVRWQVGHWDESHAEFNRKEFREAIYKLMEEYLKAEIIKEKFGGVFGPGSIGGKRELLKVDWRLWDAFIDELCIQRHDAARYDWDVLVGHQTKSWLSKAREDLVYDKGDNGGSTLRRLIPLHLKSTQLKDMFHAEIAYDRERDRLNVECDQALLDKAIEGFAANLNRLKPLAMDENRELRRFEEMWSGKKRSQAEEMAAEIARLREELSAERSAREKAEAEVARLTRELEGLKRGPAEAPPLAREAGRPASAGTENAATGDSVDQDSEIRRLRHEWSDSDLDMEGGILALRAELAQLEAELSALDNELDHVNSVIDRELKKYCEDTGESYWTEEELERLVPIYSEFDSRELHPTRVAWASLYNQFRDRHRQEFEGINSVRRPLKKKCEDLRALIAHEEKKREDSRKKYEARLARYGASLDPSVLCDAFPVGGDFRDDDVAEPDYVLPGLPLEKVGCLAGPGGLGKTQIMTQMGIDIACGRHGLLKGGVLHIYGEDDQVVMAQRRKAILANLYPKLSEREFADVKSNFVPWHLDGKRVDLADAQSEGAKVFRRNVRLVERELRRGGVQLRLIVLDTLSVFNGGRETLSEHVHAMLEAMRGICMETGASLVFLHHTTKEGGGSGNSGAGSVRGHSSLTNDVRWVTILSGMTGKEARELGVNPADSGAYVKMTLAKCNSVAPRKPEWLRMTDSGVFVPAEFGQARAPKPLAAKEPEIASATAARSESEAPGTVSALPAQTKSESSSPTSQQPDSSGIHMGQAVKSPRSRRSDSASQERLGRFNRSFEG